jgi:two-component system, OmpR family, phosphate regulon sensor histidine kinase PhoR
MSGQSINFSADGLFDLLSGLTDEALIFIDRRYTVLSANDKALDIFGDRILSLPLNNFIRHPDFSRSVDAAIVSGELSDLTYTRNETVRRNYRIRVVPIGEKLAALSLLDLTKSHLIEKIQTDFVANVSHELRSPLTAITGFIETLQDAGKGDPEALERFLPIMQDEAGRMQRLINDLLSLSKIEVEEFLPPTAEVQLVNLINRVIDNVSQRAGLKSMSVQFINQFSLMDQTALVHGNEDGLSQVFHNLLENAINYGHPNTDIRLELGMSEDEKFIRIDLINQGDGIPEKHISRITERFYRVDKSRTRESGGTGLGLAIVKHMVNWHQGRLDIDSKIGGETRFSVYLPCIFSA